MWGYLARKKNMKVRVAMVVSRAAMRIFVVSSFSTRSSVPEKCGLARFLHEKGKQVLPVVYITK